MTNKWRKSNMDLSHHLFSLLLETWKPQQQCGLQGASLNDLRRAWEFLQQNNAVDQMPVEFLIAMFCHHVSSWILILTTPPWTSHQWRLYWPCLLNGQGPKPGLNCSPFTVEIIGIVSIFICFWLLLSSFVSWTFNATEKKVKGGTHMCYVEGIHASSLRLFNGNTALQCLECNNAVEICNRIMFDFYPGLPHMVYVVLYVFGHCNLVW